MNKREILEALIDKKKAAVLHILLNASEEMYLKEIAEKSDVSITSTFRILQEFVKLKIIQRKEWKTSKVYFADKNSPATFLKELFSEPFDGVSEFVQAVKDVSGIKNIIHYNPKKEGKVNILIIGKIVETETLEKEKQRLKEKGFDLSYLLLEKKQYEQMVEMGLYAGEKKVLLYNKHYS